MLAAGVTLICSTVWAQPAESLETYKAKYPGQHVVQQLSQEIIKIDIVKSKPVIKSTVTEKHLILSNVGITYLTEDKIDISAFEKVKNINAYSLVPAGKSMQKIPASNFKTRDADTEGSVFHDGSKVTSFMFTGLEEGASRFLSYETELDEFRFPFGNSFVSGIPTEEAMFQIDMDTSVHLIFKTYNFEGHPISFTEKVVKNRRLLTWTYLNAKPFKSETSAPSVRYYIPQVYAQIAYYNTKGGRVTGVATPEELHNWYRENVKKVLAEVPTEELQSIVQELVKDKTNELDKVKAVYYWVQDNIKYIAFEEGMDGLVPRSPSNVCSKRFGDCKDMAALINSMLRIAGIESYLTWIGSRNLPFKYSEFPSKAADDHMIAIYKNGKDIYFLDATSSFQPITYPTSFIIGKEGLAHISEDKGEIITVPIPSKDMTTVYDTSWISYDHKKILGKGSTTVSGYYNILMHDRVKHTPADKMNKTIESICRKGNNTFKAENAAVFNLDDREASLLLTYDFEVDNYINSYENETYVNMILDKALTKETEFKDTRTTPFEMDFYSSDNYCVILTIPAGMKVKSLPKATAFNAEFVDYKIEYSQTKNQVMMSLHVDFKFLVLYQKDFNQWNEFIRLMKKSMSETVVLEKTK